MKNWLTGEKVDTTILKSREIGSKTINEIRLAAIDGATTGAICLADLDIKNKTVKSLTKKPTIVKSKPGATVLPPQIKLHWFQSKHTVFYPNPTPIQLTADNIMPNKSSKAQCRHLLIKEFAGCTNPEPGYKVVTIDFMAYFYKKLPATVKTLKEMAQFFSQKIRYWIKNDVTVVITFDKGQFGSLTKLATQVP